MQHRRKMELARDNAVLREEAAKNANVLRKMQRVLKVLEGDVESELKRTQEPPGSAHAPPRVRLRQDLEAAEARLSALSASVATLSTELQLSEASSAKRKADLQVMCRDLDIAIRGTKTAAATLQEKYDQLCMLCAETVHRHDALALARRAEISPAADDTIHSEEAMAKDLQAQLAQEKDLRCFLLAAVAKREDKVESNRL
eukprot:COSAG05_NODE_480_length_9412_cov_614.073537_9_plen_201_part_00